MRPGLARRPSLCARLRRWLQPVWGLRLPPADYADNDLNLSNILTDGARITGVVDWDEFGLGSRALDLVVLALDCEEAGDHAAADRLLARAAEVAGDDGLRCLVSYRASPGSPISSASGRRTAIPTGRPGARRSRPSSTGSRRPAAPEGNVSERQLPAPNGSDRPHLRARVGECSRFLQRVPSTSAQCPRSAHAGRGTAQAERDLVQAPAHPVHAHRGGTDSAAGQLGVAVSLARRAHRNRPTRPRKDACRASSWRAGSLYGPRFQGWLSSPSAASRTGGWPDQGANRRNSRGLWGGVMGARQFAFINPIRRHSHRFRLTTCQLRLTCDAGPAPRMAASGWPG